ncbi:hypothetical protein SCUP234_10605 [Seiridium cupressi]
MPEGSLKKPRLGGLDITFDAAPSHETLPTIINLRHWNVKDSVPGDFAGTYDIVHGPFFSFVLLNDEVSGVVKKLHALLKPGGYLQWEEADLETLRFDKTRPECKTDCLDELFKLPAIQDHCLKPTWAGRLPEILSEEGFMEIDRDTRGAPPFPPPTWSSFSTKPSSCSTCRSRARPRLSTWLAH